MIRDADISGRPLFVHYEAPTTRYLHDWREDAPPRLTEEVQFPPALWSSTADYVVVSIGSAMQAASLPYNDDPPWVAYLDSRLEDLEWRLVPGYPARDTLRAARHVARSVLGPASPTPSVVPGEEGTVDLVWRRGGWHIELEIGRDSTYVWAKNLGSGEVLSGDLEDLRSVIGDVINGTSGARQPA